MRSCQTLSVTIGKPFIIGIQAGGFENYIIQVFVFIVNTLSELICHQSVNHFRRNGSTFIDFRLPKSLAMMLIHSFVEVTSPKEKKSRGVRSHHAQEAILSELPLNHTCSCPITASTLGCRKLFSITQYRFAFTVTKKSMDHSQIKFRNGTSNYVLMRKCASSLKIAVLKLAHLSSSLVQSSNDLNLNNFYNLADSTG